MKTGPSEIVPENVQVIFRDQLKDTYKAEFEVHLKHYEECWRFKTALKFTASLQVT
jgi:hypothetical protein